MSSTSKQAPIDKYPEKEKELTPRKSPISLDLTQKILGYLKLYYDVVENLQKMKANIIVFDLCKIKQLRDKLWEALQHIQGPWDEIVSNTKVTPKGNNTKATKSAKK